MTRLVPPLLAVFALVGLAVACAEVADPDNEARFRAAATPLVEASDLLAEHEALVVAGRHDEARARWPAVATMVADVVEAYDPHAPGVAGGLGPGQRSALVGLHGGLQVALMAWDVVDDALAALEAGAGSQDDLARALADARRRMELLERLAPRSG